MKVSKNGIHLIKHFEGVRNRPYKCQAGLWTIGVGHVIGNGQQLFESWNRVFSLVEIETLLAKDLERFERGVEKLISVPLKQHQFDALVSFAFNLGLGCLQRSTLRQKLNRGDTFGAIKSWLKYNKVNGQTSNGLVRRRNAEVTLFLTSANAV